MGTSAWQVREMERKQVLGGLHSRAHELREGVYGDELFFFRIARLILFYLAEQTFSDGPTGDFCREVVEEIESFARTDEERDALIARFLEKIIESIVISFNHGLNVQELEASL